MPISLPFIKIEGIEGFTSKVESIGPAISAAVKAVALEIKGVISKYPPAREESTYRRTMGLFKSWSIRQPSPDSAVIGNNRSYGPFVQARETQARIHQGIWRTVEDVSEEYEPIVKERISEAINQVVESDKTWL
jgi:hypothetical protein